mmetsp:Transcript_45031/g.109467  ORF Transcript_45031/g.109467 Transcript_45031/m.109467 type:complete len:242 (-) Transcript_45031:3016-3741(-)
MTIAWIIEVFSTKTIEYMQGSRNRSRKAANSSLSMFGTNAHAAGSNNVICAEFEVTMASNKSRLNSRDGFEDAKAVTRKISCRPTISECDNSPWRLPLKIVLACSKTHSSSWRKSQLCCRDDDGAHRSKEAMSCTETFRNRISSGLSWKAKPIALDHRFSSVNCKTWPSNVVLFGGASLPSFCTISTTYEDKTRNTVPFFFSGIDRNSDSRISTASSASRDISPPFEFPQSSNEATSVFPD